MANIDEYVAGATIPECVRIGQLLQRRIEQWERDIAEGRDAIASTFAPNGRRKRTVQLTAGITAPAGDLDDEEVEAAQ